MPPKVLGKQYKNKAAQSSARSVLTPFANGVIEARGG